MLRDTVELTEWDMHRPCVFCGSPDCDPDDMETWVSHMATWHGYKVTENVPASPKGDVPRTVRMKLVGWSEHTHFAANQQVRVKAGVQQRALVGRQGTVVGWNPSTAQYAVSFAEEPTVGILEPTDLDTHSPADSK
jgi:hypothetical protein